MDRLTDNTNYCTVWTDCEMREVDCEFHKNCYERKMYEKLKAYEDAEEQGLLIRLPCKIGTEVWTLCSNVVYGEVGDKPEVHYYISKKPFALSLYVIGKNVGKIFLTRKEAEKALAEMEK